MTCQELRDHYELYALGLGEDPERAEIRAHLERGCETCMAGVKHARELTALLGASTPLVEPPARLRRRVLAAAGAEQSGAFAWALVFAATTAVCLTAAVYFGGRERDYARENGRLREMARMQTIELARMNVALEILNAPGTTEASFGKEQQAPPRGRVWVNPKGGVLLIASNLPAAPAGKIYEMWVIPKGGKPVPAGLFQSDVWGSAVHVQRGPVDAAVVAVTLENEGGAPQPTSTPVIAASLGG
jgi:anti-sigma-K factor RskA